MSRRPLGVTIMVLFAQALLAFLALVFLFGVAIQVADRGGGRSGIQARSNVTLADRVTEGAVLLAAGSLSLAGVGRLARGFGDRR
ncbi:hypothetical protein [Paludisphaera soli]|uniref:hypothetical protein n=1 Tax=Paludisphaera soli TaxID=2712865 RepID=UPI0013EE2F55|nr:hypothetical protein [Paludisphaera soli]